MNQSYKILWLMMILLFIGSCTPKPEPEPKPMVKVKSLAIVSEENQYLREKNLQLNLELESILYAADENIKLRKLLDFKRDTK